MSLNADSRLYQQVAEQLAEAITRGDFPVGTRLPAERKLAERFNVSRPTLREAVISLEIAGYVEVKGGSGVYITGQGGGVKASEKDVGALEVLEARILFESEAAGLAAKHITPEELAELEQTLQELVLESDEETPEESADRRFHLTIAKACKNAAIESTIEHLWRLRNNSPLPEAIISRVRQAGAKTRIKAHKDIFNALKAQDSEKAKAAMRNHLTHVVEQLLEASEAQAVEEAKQKSATNRARLKMLGG
ncbi:FadR/GntR family transcriptional regulator [Simiduia litorea]|uniref:FadR/GntR family transcriptional regulator n=1 Tax=Simiduia curdlanivorans TaxID=1492769 RepID=A0ABV8V148_9GAMM